MNYFTTAFNPTGNRLVEACPSLSNSSGKVSRKLQVFTSSLDEMDDAIWAVGSSSSSSQFVVSHRNLTVNHYNFGTNGVNETFQLQDSPERPVMASFLDDDKAKLVPTLEYPPLTSNFSAAVPLEDGGWLYVTRAQNLRQVRPNGADVTSLSLAIIDDPLVDASIAYSPTNKLWAIYTGATTSQYTHGVLGDAEEAASLHILQYDVTLQLVSSALAVELGGDDLVFEGLGPMWADLNGDGIDDLITTISGTDKGSALAVYFLAIDDNNNETSANDEEIRIKDASVTSNFIGTGNRWLHQVAAGPLGPNGEIEIVEIRTPHIGGQVRYYQLQQDSLEFVAGTGHFTSHSLGSRNLDTVTVGDFDGDGVPELVVQDQEGENLYGLQRTLCGVNVAWSVSLPSAIQTNIAASCNTETNAMNILFATRETLMRLEFTPTSEDTTGIGALAACEAAGGGDGDSGGENGSGNGSDNTDTSSSAFIRTFNDAIGIMMFGIILIRWLCRDSS